jgi:hypothetical protein
MYIHCCLCHALPRYSPPPQNVEGRLTCLDLLWSWISLYNTVMKIFFIGSSVYILYLMKGPLRPTHDPNIDTFKIEYLFIGSFVASMLFNYQYVFAEVFLCGVCRWRRLSGHSVFGLKVSLSYLNYSSFKEQVKQKTLQPIIYLPLELIVHYTFPIGFIDTQWMIIGILLLFSLDWFKYNLFLRFRLILDRFVCGFCIYLCHQGS